MSCSGPLRVLPELSEALIRATEGAQIDNESFSGTTN